MTTAAQNAASPRMMIGRYVILDRIGRGGMGMVYRALDESLEREVALKILTLEGVGDEESRRRFAVEARAAAQLQHANIVTVFELGEERGIPFIAMELLPGSDLESLLRSGEHLLLTEKLDIMVQVCRGLAYAHDHHIVHRDVKPSNIRLLDEGGVKIMDFGIAKLGGTNLTRAGMVVGTVHYMSPEQVRGRPLDGRSDIFSAGVVLHELVTGVRPFDGSNATEILYKIVQSPAPALPERADPTEGRLRGILDRALAKDPDQRYPSAAAMADALGEAQALVSEAGAGANDEATLEGVSAARRVLKGGHIAEGLAQIEGIVRAHPNCVEARRALRTARRQVTQTERQPTALLDDGFPELAATFQLPPTLKTADTVRADAPVAAGTMNPLGRLWIWLGAGLMVLAVAAGLLLLVLRGRSGAQPERLAVRSQPSGARVLVDGRDSGVVTDVEVVIGPGRSESVVVLKKEGYQEARRTVKLPLGSNRLLTVALTPEESALLVTSEPAGARVTLDGRRLAGVTPLSVPLDRTREHHLAVALDGYGSRERTLAAGAADDQVLVKLEAAAPTAQVAIASAYPIDVIWNGKTLARGRVSPRVDVPAGRQVLTLVAPSHSLKSAVTVEAVAGSPVSISAPGLGRINIQARPDNCEILIDDVFVDFPPILDRPIAAGGHRVQFKWPNGARTEETIEVVEGRPVFVMGRPR
jgi:hypothetical protein